MIDAAGEYLIHLVSASLICSLILRLCSNQGGMGVAIKLICGMFLIYCAVVTTTQLRIVEWEDFADEVRMDAKINAAEGEAHMYEAISQSIKQKTQAYILEKAQAMNTDLAVEVELSDDAIPLPVAVCISGNVSPYARSRLAELIANDLGIDKERQIWM